MSKKMKFEFSKDDIDKKLATNAHYWTSFTPEKRAEQEQSEYYHHLDCTYKNLLEVCETEAQKELLIEEMNRYKQGYITRFNALLSSKSRCASPMITGPANFPVERNKKRMKSAENKYQELKEYSEKVIKIISKKLDNSRTGEQVNNDEFERLKKELDRYIEWNGYVQGYQVALFADKIKRSFANGNYEAVKMLLEYIKADQEERKVTHFSNRHSVWKLAEQTTIKKVEESKKTGEELITELSDIKIVNNHDDERVRIFFPGKPSPEVITLLKKSAWKWSPFNKAWQRKNTRDAIYSANRIIESIRK